MGWGTIRGVCGEKHKKIVKIYKNKKRAKNYQHCCRLSSTSRSTLIVSSISKPNIDSVKFDMTKSSSSSYFEKGSDFYLWLAYRQKSNTWDSHILFFRINLKRNLNIGKKSASQIRFDFTCSIKIILELDISMTRWI